MLKIRGRIDPEQDSAKGEGTKKNEPRSGNQAAILNNALEGAFEKTGCVFMERPNEIWWNNYIQNPDDFVTRDRLEFEIS